MLRKELNNLIPKYLHNIDDWKHIGAIVPSSRNLLWTVWKCSKHFKCWKSISTRVNIDQETFFRSFEAFHIWPNRSIASPSIQHLWLSGYMPRKVGRSFQKHGYHSADGRSRVKAAAGVSLCVVRREIADF